MVKPWVRQLAVLIDLNGTLHVGEEVIPGCIDALQRLRKNNRICLKFVTNTSLESSNLLERRLEKLGIPFSESEIFSSLTAAKNEILKHSLRPMLLLEEEALSDFKGRFHFCKGQIVKSEIDQDNPNAVVVGLAPSRFNYETLNKAFRLLMSKESTKLIAIHVGRFYRKSDGLSLGPGPFVAALQYATNAQVEVVGKPETSFFHSALKTLSKKLEPCEAVMIGDDVRDDVLGAIKAGMHGILVRTGKYREGDELQISESTRNCVNDFAAAVDLVEKSLDDQTLLK